MNTMEAQDPGELFDLYDESGAPLGLRKPRALVHRDGDWHRSVHVWVVLSHLGVAGAEEGAWVLFQRRSLAKDTWPGAIDVAVTGHLSAGESILDALRESDEEIGLHLPADQVVTLGLRRKADDRRPGIRDFELQSILFATTTVALAALRPHPVEVDSLLALPIAVARDLFAGNCTSAKAVRLDIHLVLSHEEIRAADFVPSGDGYYARALASITDRLSGVEASPWEIGP
jgi:isopentenyldiphosphate isomerase